MEFKVNVQCSNCGYDGRIKIPVGKVVELTPCPVCGCTKLGLSYSPRPEPVTEGV